MRGKVLTWIGCSVVVLAAAGLGAYLGVVGLDKANEVSGLLGTFVILAGLGVAVYGIFQAHKDAAALESAVKASARPAQEGQSVRGSTANSVALIKGVTGSVRIGKPPNVAAPSGDAGPAWPEGNAVTREGAAGQTVEDSHIRGDIVQIDGAGDVDIDKLNAGGSP